MTLAAYLSQITERAEANRKYTSEFKFAAHDKIELISQTATLHMCLQDRCDDIARLVAIVRELEAALEHSCLVWV